MLVPATGFFLAFWWACGLFLMYFCSIGFREPNNAITIFLYLGGLWAKMRKNSWRGILSQVGKIFGWHEFYTQVFQGFFTVQIDQFSLLDLKTRDKPEFTAWFEVSRTFSPEI